MPPADGAAWVASIEADPPTEVGGRAVVSVQTYPEANLVRLMLDGGVRLQIRPSGTEPKVKLYGEAVDLDPADLQSLLEALAHSSPRTPRRLDRTVTRIALSDDSGPRVDLRSCERHRGRWRWSLRTRAAGAQAGVPNWRSPASPRPGTMKASSFR